MRRSKVTNTSCSSRLRGLLLIPGLAVLALCRSVSAHPPTPLPEDPALVQIGVEVVEVDENKSQKLGIDWISTLNVAESNVPALLTLGTLTRDHLFATIQALVENGAADMLANPKLVTRDNTTANFHAGGELPYSTAGSLGTVSVEFKAYGVNLKIKPHINAEHKIEMSVEVEVSGPDDQNSVTLSGNTVPAIRSRTVSSELTMDAGSTLSLAGLIQKDKEVQVTGIPGLMSIPGLGRLFRHQTDITRKTSIVIFVTPSILSGGNGLAKPA